MAVMDFWVCFISDTLLNLHWTVAALGPTPHVRSFKFVRVFDETSQTAQVSNICDHSFTSPWQPQSSKCQWKIELTLVGSCLLCWLLPEAPGWDLGRHPFSEGALWSIFTCSLCCKSLKKLSLLSCHLPITQPRRRRAHQISTMVRRRKHCWCTLQSTPTPSRPSWNKQEPL